MRNVAPIWHCIILILLAFSLAASAFTIVSPPEFNGLFFSSPSLACLRNPHPVTGPVVLAGALPHEILQNSSVRFDGYVIFVNSSQIELNLDANGDWELFRWKRRGAAAVVVIDVPNSAAAGSFAIVMPSVQLIQMYPNLTVSLSPDEPNMWEQVRRRWSVPFRLVFSVLSGLTASLAFAKFMAYLKVFGPQLSVANICLPLTGIATLYRCIYHALDPFGLGSLFGGVVTRALASISFPADLFGMLLVSLYWAELMHRSKVNVSNFLERFRWVFLAVVTLALILEIVASVQRAITVNSTITSSITGAVYAIFTFALTLLFFFHGFQVVRQLMISSKIASQQQQQTDRAAARRTLLRTSFFLIGSGVFNLIWVAGMIMVSVPQFFLSPLGYYITWTVLWTGVTGSSLTQVLAFRTPNSMDSRLPQMTQGADVKNDFVSDSAPVSVISDVSYAVDTIIST